MIGGIKLEATEVVAVAALLRVINVLENERSARDLVNRIKIATNNSQIDTLAALAISEIDDAIEVLVGGGLHKKAQNQFNKAKKNVQMAADATTSADKIAEANQALNNLQGARDNIIAP